VNGKTVAQRIPSGPAVERSKQQVAEYKRFRELARELIEISDQICDLQLENLESVREVETKKKRHRRKSAR
jgi:DNA-binding HxlR family transcriptional regulator